MIRVLIDTNVLLDLLLAREPFATDARAIWIACEEGRCIGFVAAISVTTIWYIGRKQIGLSAARQHIAHILTTLRVAPVDASVLNVAQASSIVDFEDAVQASSAAALGIEMIVTRNGGDFAGTSLKVLTPAQFLHYLT
ncbi:type II toxin-antitoxin system VapC family toxin [Candidatus Oscillochloris fontis]|uniref:type II toxin-antitoxin system VapC family toxin n=1 Tax=Candidatus Oscillochloris fontis TaxID=2496868 RepID=UPI00101CA571|nr:PIN domain-containing protein [Candidatus Oscillochloris fontis]